MVQIGLSVKSTIPLLSRYPRSFLPLLVTLVTVQVTAPFIEQSALAASVAGVVLLMTCLLAVQPSARLRIAAIAGLCVVAALRLAWLHLDERPVSLGIIAPLVTAAYVTAIAVHVFLTVIRHRDISHDTIAGAVCIYLLAAHAFALAYLAVESSSPGSITGIEREAMRVGVGGGWPLSRFLYFSFITLTTLGYGDMVPVSPAARALVILEAMSGQFFLVVFVARLVGSMGLDVKGKNGPSDA